MRVRLVLILLNELTSAQSAKMNQLNLLLDFLLNRLVLVLLQQPGALLLHGGALEVFDLVVSRNAADSASVGCSLGACLVEVDHGDVSGQSVVGF